MTDPAPPLIRRLTPDDWRAARDVRLEALADAPYAFSSTLERERGFTEQVWRDRLHRSPSFGAELPGGPLAGIATGFRESGGDWHLTGMWVSPALRGQGAAGRLVAAVCEAVRAAGAPRVDLWVTEVNPRARAFYLREGFVPTGDRALVRPEEPDHWEERMTRALG